MALQIITLSDLKDRSSLAEVQALDEGTAEPLELDAITLIEKELGRRITLDSADTTKRVSGSGLKLLPLPECLSSLTSCIGDVQGIGVNGQGIELAPYIELRYGGWGMWMTEYKFSSTYTIIGKWGWTADDRVIAVVMDLVIKLAVRKDDPMLQRDMASPWDSLSEGGVNMSRGQNREKTADNLLTYDLKQRLAHCHRPTRVALF